MPEPAHGEEEEGAEPAESEQQTAVNRQIRRKMQLSQMGRLLMMAVCAGAGALAPCFDLVATVLPLLFPKTVIFIRTLLEKK